MFFLVFIAFFFFFFFFVRNAMFCFDKLHCLLAIDDRLQVVQVATSRLQQNFFGIPNSNSVFCRHILSPHYQTIIKYVYIQYSCPHSQMMYTLWWNVHKIHQLCSTGHFFVCMTDNNPTNIISYCVWMAQLKGTDGGFATLTCPVPDAQCYKGLKKITWLPGSYLHGGFQCATQVENSHDIYSFHSYPKIKNI